MKSRIENAYSVTEIVSPNELVTIGKGQENGTKWLGKGYTNDMKRIGK